VKSSERILVVDDEPAMLRTVERVLAAQYGVSTARTEADALAALGAAPHDLAIVDLRMPDHDGFDVAAALRHVAPDLDVIFMTGVVHELDQQLVRSLREKAFYFIQKPFEREVLLALVNRCLELRRLETENRAYVAQLEGQLAEARAFQQSMLPPRRARLGVLELAAHYAPSEHVSGDLFDYVRGADGGASVLIADVSGHGVSAAMLTGVVKAAFHDVHEEGDGALAVVARIASGLRPFDEARFVTAFCAVIDARRQRLVYVNAGHPAPLLLDASGARGELSLTGAMISPAFPDMTWEERSVPFGPGCRLLAYTDGITEARGDEGAFGVARLRAVVDATGARGALLLDVVVGAVTRFCGGRPADDDRTLLTVCWP